MNQPLPTNTNQNQPPPLLQQLAGSTNTAPSAPPLPAAGFLVCCPHCNIPIEVLELNCRIFRCGILKETFTQIGPHLSKLECDALVARDAIYGCGKPFCIPEGSQQARICDYV